MNYRMQAAIREYASLTIGYGPIDDDEDPDWPLTEEERAKEAEEDLLFRGLFTYAVTIVIDQLLEDITTLRDPDASMNEMLQLDLLPPAMASQYNSSFARALLICVAEVGRKFAEGWSLASCLAEELAVELILNEAKVLAELAELQLDWRIDEHLDRLLEDTDYKMLYNTQARTLGSQIFDVSTWFKPFNDHRHVHTYARMDLDKGDE